MQPAAWREVVRSPGGDRHIVQVYRERGFLVAAVAAWLGESLRRAGGAVLACSPRSAREILARLRAEGVDVDAMRASDRLVVLDGEDFLARFMRDGAPQRELFLPLARGALARVRRHASPGAEVRVWGEMVDMLVKRGQAPAAQRLESIWNELIQEEGIRLLCSYEIDHLAPFAHEGPLAGACHGHTVLFAEEDPPAFERALENALVEVFGELEAARLRLSLAAERPLPITMSPAEAVLVGLQRQDPGRGALVLTSVRRQLGLPAA